MDPQWGIIPVRSEQQAMDWSLALLSQGVESTIEPPDADHGWQLVIEASQQAHAREVIRLYRIENRRISWAAPVPGTGLWFDARSFAWFAVMIVFYLLSQNPSSQLRTAGVMDNHAVHSGEWWRIFTAVMLHGDLGHLAANVTTGIIFLGLAMGSFGSGLSALVAYLAGAGGNFWGLLFHWESHRSLGSSGMVMGALGLLTAQALSWRGRGVAAWQLAARGLASGFLLLILLGMDPSTDVIAHVGGFVTGLAFGALLAFCPQQLLQHTWLNRAADIICAALMILTWSLALRR